MIQSIYKARYYNLQSAAAGGMRGPPPPNLPELESYSLSIGVGMASLLYLIISHARLFVIALLGLKRGVL